MRKVKFISRREWYEKRMIEIAELLPTIKQAIADFSEGRIQSYSLAFHNISRQFASLKDLLDFYKDLMLEYEELDNVLHGRSRRHVDVMYCQRPTIVRKW